MKRILLLVVVLIGLAPWPAEAGYELGWVAVQGTSIRADHSRTALRVARVTEGDQLLITRYWDDWGFVTSGKARGWVALGALRRDARPDKMRRCYDTTFGYSACAPDWISEAITHEAKRYGVDRNLMMRIAACESDFKPTTLGTAGEIGIFQWLPETWDTSETVGNIHDSWNQTTSAAKFLAAGYGWWWTCWRRIVQGER